MRFCLFLQQEQWLFALLALAKDQVQSGWTMYAALELRTGYLIVLLIPLDLIIVLIGKMLE